MTQFNAQHSQSAQQEDRLPCRGCQATCAHRYSCDGKPWRMERDVVKPARYSSLNDYQK